MGFIINGSEQADDAQCQTKLDAPSVDEYEADDMQPSGPLIAKTEHGYVKGYWNHRSWHTRSKTLSPLLKPDTPRAFVGIPFADPPILTLRFKPPQPFSKPWNTKNPNKVRKAVTYSKACIQPLPKRQGEDCLYLNVFVPHPERVEKWTKQGKKLPVLVWIQGGAFILGSSSEYRIYDGHYLTKKQDVLVVTLNYRMGAFGFLAVDGKTDSIEGNFALQDQLMAIQWVKRNIANFGGDPDNITLIGQSAGAYSIAILMGSKMVPPNLFKRAVLMSTPFNVLARRKEEMKMLGKGFAHKVGCVKQETNGSDYVDTSCLRKVSVLKLMCAQLKGMNRFGKGTKLADLFLWWPHLDGQWLNENPLNMILSRPQNAVPSIIGTTRDEGGLFTALLDMAIVGQLAGKRRTYGKTYIDGKIDQNFGRDATTMGDMYTFGKDIKTNAEQLVRLATDYFFTCPTIHYATAVSVFKEVYVYDVSQLQHFLSFGLCNKRYVCHASDLPLLWRPFFFPLTKKQQAVSERLINHVVGFANGDINQKSTQPWPVFKSASLTDGAYMDFGDIVQTRVGLRAATCPTWMTQLGHDW